MRASFGLATSIAAGGYAVACGGGSDGGATTADGGGSDGGASTADGGNSEGATGGPSSEGGGADGAASEAGNPGNGEGGNVGDTGALLVPPGYLNMPAVSSFVYTTDFGSPYDSILASPIQSGQSAIAQPFTTAPTTGQITSSYSLQLIDSTSDLYTSLDVSASLSVSDGAGSVSAKADFAQAHTVDTTKLVIFADSTAVGLTQKIVNPQLTAQAAALSPANFYALYGDRYASQIVTGIELFGTIEVDTSSEEDKQSLAAQLNVSYGASSFQSSLTSNIKSTLSGRNVKVNAQAIGVPTPAFNDDPAQFLAAVSSFAQMYSLDAGANTNGQALQIVYTSYYGIPGYPGVPAGTDVRVADHAQAASDYLFYNSLVTNDFKAYFLDPNYSSLPFLTHMQKYQSDLQAYLKNSLTNSQGIPAPPAPAADGTIADYTTISTPSSQGPPEFVIHSLANGFVPKRIGDYEIPLRYLHGGTTLNGTTFSPVLSVPPNPQPTSPHPVAYQLYPVDKTVYPAPQDRVLSYRWGKGTYMFPGVFTGGLPDPAKVSSAIDTLVVADYTWAGAGSLPTHFVLVNKATGKVLQDNGARTFTSLADFVAPPSNVDHQVWAFLLNGCGGGTQWTGPSEYVYVYSPSSTDFLDISPYNEIYSWDWQCTPVQTFFLDPKENGGTVAIQGAGSDANYYIQASGTTMPGAAQVVVQMSFTGSDNQLWVLIPYENIDQYP